MPLYRSTVRHGRFAAGETVDIAAELVGQYQGEIDAGFLVPVGPGFPIGAPFRDALAAAAAEIAREAFVPAPEGTSSSPTDGVETPAPE